MPYFTAAKEYNEGAVEYPHTLEITIEVRSVYGVTKLYPICEKAKVFAAIAGSKTLTLATVRKIERLGYQVISVANADYSQGA